MNQGQEHVAGVRRSESMAEGFSVDPQDSILTFSDQIQYKARGLPISDIPELQGVRSVVEAVLQDPAECPVVEAKSVLWFFFKRLSSLQIKEIHTPEAVQRVQAQERHLIMKNARTSTLLMASQILCQELPNVQELSSSLADDDD